MLRTALNLRVSWWRRRRHELPLTLDDPVSEPSFNGGIDSRLLAALNRLPGRQREVIVLRARWISIPRRLLVVLGIAPGTVTTHLFRAATALQRQLLDNHPTAMEANS